MDGMVDPRMARLASLSIVASNWFMFLLWSIGLVVFRSVVIPREERNLVEAFGQEYKPYRKVTGA
jgi:protein-S-isoprenylcysteine O-methyltransferase Ste14